VTRIRLEEGQEERWICNGLSSFRHVRLKDASTLSAKGLSVLKQHKVVDLIVNGLKITVNDLINCLGDWSIQNLRSLSVAKGSFMDFSRLLLFLFS